MHVLLNPLYNSYYECLFVVCFVLEWEKIFHGVTLKNMHDLTEPHSLSLFLDIDGPATWKLKVMDPHRGDLILYRGDDKVHYGGDLIFLGVSSSGVPLVTIELAFLFELPLINIAAIHLIFTGHKMYFYQHFF